MLSISLADIAPERSSHTPRGREKATQIRSEKTEGTFVQIHETGGAGSTCLTSIDKVRKCYLISARAYSLGVLTRVLFQMRTPRSCILSRLIWSGAFRLCISLAILRLA